MHFGQKAFQPGWTLPPPDVYLLSLHLGEKSLTDSCVVCCKTQSPDSAMLTVGGPCKCKGKKEKFKGMQIKTGEIKMALII